MHSDGFSGYNKLKDVTRCGCWAHLRRKFVEAIQTRKSNPASLTSAEIGRDYCNQLFKIEESLKDLSPKERFLNVSNWKNQFLRLFGAGLKILPFSKARHWEKQLFMPGTKNYTWKTIFWMVALRFLIMQLKMLSVHSLLVGRIGCLRIPPKGLLHRLSNVLRSVFY